MGVPQSEIRNQKSEIAAELCEVCGAPGRFHAEAKRCDILQCPQCRLLWTNPLICSTGEAPTDQPYWAEDVYLKNASWQTRRFRRQLHAFLSSAQKSEIRNQKSEIRVLEVGCGMGFFLDACDALGLQAEGRDLSARAVAFANRRRVRARAGTLDDSYPDASLDAIFAFNLIEHLPHPREFLVLASRKLKPGGAIVLETPIQESLLHRAASLVRWLTRGRIGFLGLSPGGHLYKFSLRSLDTLSRQLGLECVFRRRLNSPFREIWGKSALFSFDFKLLYRLGLPLLWALAWATRQGNRVLLILRKPSSDV
ncbi:MAG: class I SAM-dependent methyltransferase [Planctomycetes bacterium]|nr:class I SAM-dependent methyltransferase [Planctomycetota bacterium]